MRSVHKKIAVDDGECNNIISPPYYVSSNIFNSRIAIFMRRSRKLQSSTMDAKTLTTVWERPFCAGRTDTVDRAISEFQSGWALRRILYRWIYSGSRHSDWE